ncbi:MAG: 4-hydroxythreonine-4-phosphate dehydrogenase PdxA [Muribaculaceae bacterium]|nr:4-hydroxythreonine-4-phosphate dehydrogenase PdxA [Muribaculaceae bacterium]
MSNNKIKVGITQGDTNGVGYEVILKTLEDNRLLELCTPVVYGSAKIAAYYRKGLEMPSVPLNTINEASQAKADANNIINVVGEDVKVEPGVATPEAGRAAFQALERAVADLKNGDIDVLVTAPINKNTIQSDDFHFAGHTEYLASCAGDGADALMILCNDRLRVALVTTHCPIAKVAEEITTERIVAKLKAFYTSLESDFGLSHPRIAVLALNPHAGDGGVIGDEEANIIIPAIKEAKNAGVNCFGPYPADGFFGAGQYEKFDGVLAMYHDQGLAPFKTLAMAGGVNFTAGLPFVRTSPDHGTGYDIVLKGAASEQSMREAIYAAIDIYRNRQRYSEAHRNPLRRQYFDRSKDNVVLDLTKED